MAEVIPMQQKRSIDELAAKRIPPRFHQVTLDNYVPKTESQRIALTAVRAWVDDIEHAPMLALIGETGTGKSHLLYAAAHLLYERCAAATARPRPPAPFVKSWYQFVDELRFGKSFSTEGGIRTEEPSEIRRDWWERPVCMLDEVRATSGTSFDDTELARFACYAYDNQRAVLITSNVHPLAEVMGAPAASRFAEIVIVGPDGRKARR
jgi:chromosomal replication initiation ATPase DnaA